MPLQTLRIHNLRNLADVPLALSPGANVFLGGNGAGKTSILEATYLLSHGHSFRSTPKEALLKRGSPEMHVFSQVHRGEIVHRVGLGRAASRWESRVDGAPVPLGHLLRYCAVVCFEPGSHALIAGGPEERRRFLDWGVFHVEHEFLSTWSRYLRAWKQRNHLLRRGVTESSQYTPWDQALQLEAERLDAWRNQYLFRWLAHLKVFVEWLLPELGEVSIAYRRGWPDEESLSACLTSRFQRDLQRGHTTAGSHRADWQITFTEAPQREHLSRGQGKLTALACLLAQVTLHAEMCGDWPVLCLDDLASELDDGHHRAVLEWLAQTPAQCLITGTHRLEAWDVLRAQMFHVEHGRVRSPGLL